MKKTIRFHQMAVQLITNVKKKSNSHIIINGTKPSDNIFKGTSTYFVCRMCTFIHKINVFF